MVADPASISLVSDVSAEADPGNAPAARRTAPQKPSSAPSDPPAVPEKAPRRTRRRWTRGALFLPLPLALILGGYWYVTGGQVMSTDNAYVQADQVGISTDVSGIVRDVDVSGESAHRGRPGPVPS